MSPKITTTWIVAITLIGMFVTRSLEGAIDQGVAKRIPWSGYWWPVAKGELLGPLQKYDAVYGKRAQWWELENKPPGPHVPPWHGYCHGWAAAAVLEKEPTAPRLVSRSAGNESVVLTVADQKGWLSASHAFDVANYYGDRYGDGEGTEDIQDMAPDMLWQLLKTFIKEHGVAMVMDLDAGEQVWNYPVFAYRVEYYPNPLGNGWFDGYLQLCAADDAVPAEYVGTVPHLQTYTFVFQMQSGAVVPGSGRWTGSSLANHPDFAWYPYATMPENPEIDYAEIKSLLKLNVRPNATPVASAVTNRVADTWLGYGHEADSDSVNGTDVPLPISPLQLVAAIANKTSSFGLDARQTEFGKVKRHVGDTFAVTGSSEQAGYLYVFHVSPDGDLSLLHPAPGQNNAIAADEEFLVPDPGQGLAVAMGPFGNHRLKVLVTKRPLSLTGLDRSHPLGIGKKAKQRPESEIERPESSAASSQPAWLGYGFRFFPTQQKQIKALLKDFAQEKSLDPDRIDQMDASRVLGSFAQDEITYYVGPRSREND